MALSDHDLDYSNTVLNSYNAMLVLFWLVQFEKHSETRSTKDKVLNSSNVAGSQEPACLIRY